MNRWMMFGMMFICMAMAVHASYDMWVSHYPDVTTVTGRDNNLSFMLLGSDSPSQSVQFYIYAAKIMCDYRNENCQQIANNSVVFNGRIGAFHDRFMMVYRKIKEEDVTLSAWDPGQYRIFWGLNLSKPVNVTLLNGSRDVYEISTMNLSDSFVLTVTGNHKNINDSIGMNESDYGKVRQRYGAGDDVVAQRMAAWWVTHSQNVTVGKANVTNATTKNVTLSQPKPVQNVTRPVVQNITRPIVPVVQPVVAPTEQPRQPVVAPVSIQAKKSPVPMIFVMVAFCVALIVYVVALRIVKVWKL